MKFRQALPVDSFPGRNGGTVTMHQIEVAPPGKRSVVVNVPQEVHSRISATLADGDEIELIASAYEWDRKTKIVISDVRKVG